MSRISICLLSVMLLAGGCSAYIGDYDYVPRPAIAQVPTTEPQAPPAATAWATVEGVRRADRDAGIPFSVEVHFQLQNTAPEMMTFDPRTLVLSDGSMINFLPPAGVPVQPMSISPGQSITLVVYFPFLPGSDLDNMKMSPLTLAGPRRSAARSSRNPAISRGSSRTTTATAHTGARSPIRPSSSPGLLCTCTVR